MPPEAPGVSVSLRWGGWRGRGSGSGGGGWAAGGRGANGVERDGGAQASAAEGVHAGEVGGQVPEPGGLLGVDGVRPDAGLVPDGDPGDVAVLEVDPAEAVEPGAGRGPDRGRGALLRRLEVDQRPTLLVDPAHRDLLLERQVALQRGEDAAGVQRERPDPGGGPELVEPDREEDVRRLRLP